MIIKEFTVVVKFYGEICLQPDWSMLFFTELTLHLQIVKGLIFGVQIVKGLIFGMQDVRG